MGWKTMHYTGSGNERTGDAGQDTRQCQRRGAGVGPALPGPGGLARLSPEAVSGKPPPAASGTGSRLSSMRTHFCPCRNFFERSQAGTRSRLLHCLPPRGDNDAELHGWLPECSPPERTTAGGHDGVLGRLVLPGYLLCEVPVIAPGPCPGFNRPQLFQ